MIPLEPEAYRVLVRLALAEDVGVGDVTSAAIVPAGLRATATLTARGDCAVSGVLVAAEVFRALDPAAETTALVQDGARCGVNQPIVAVLIKGDHIEIAGGIRDAIRRIREQVAPTAQHRIAIEVEAQTIAAVDEALAVGADTITPDVTRSAR